MKEYGPAIIDVSDKGFYFKMGNRAYNALNTEAKSKLKCITNRIYYLPYNTDNKGLNTDARVTYAISLEKLEMFCMLSERPGELIYKYMKQYTPDHYTSWDRQEIASASSDFKIIIAGDISGSIPSKRYEYTTYKYGLSANHEIYVGGTKYVKHHTALRRGYVRVNFEQLEPYSGRFGEGYIVKSHNYRSSSYYIMTYYIKEE